jgi:hypothetical protein
MGEKIIALASKVVSTERREKLASAGAAMSDGSYPIPDKDFLRRAITSYPRGAGTNGKTEASIKAHIKKRARALGATDMLPDGW